MSVAAVPRVGLGWCLTAEAPAAAHPPPARRFEAWQNRTSKAHPLYATETQAYGTVPRGMEAGVAPPEHGSTQAFTKTFILMKDQIKGKTTLDTSIAKHRYLKQLDPM